MSSFLESLETHFPGATTEEEFLSRSYDALENHGFTAENTIACVGVCRDELCRSLVWAVREVWGEAFNFSGLGGMLTLGTSGFTAAHFHAPIVGGRERYVYIVMPHIGISAEGEMGTCIRTGHHGSTAACGALTALLGEIRTGYARDDLDPNNLEYSVLRKYLAPRVNERGLDLVKLTMAMTDLIYEELQNMIALTVDPEQADYAVLTGVQIHRPVEGSMVWHNRCYATVNGERVELSF